MRKSCDSRGSPRVRDLGLGRAYHPKMVKRLTVIPTDAAVRARISGDRRRHQRRLSIGRRLGENRRASVPSGQPVSEEQRPPEEQRQRVERRGMAPRRRLTDRRSSARVFDLTNLDLSELDS